MRISPAAHTILNDANLIGHRDRWFTRLENLFDAKKDPYNEQNIFAISGICGRPLQSNRIYEDPERWVVECLEDLAEKANGSLQEYRFCPPCIESEIFGVHFIDSFFGCEIFQESGQWYSRYLQCEIGSLQAPDLDRCEAWQIAKRAALAFVAQDVALPIFGLPTIASALNIAVNLYGEEILAQMLLEPENAAHDLQVIQTLLCTLHRWYRETLPASQLQPVVSWERTQPVGYGQLCGCTTQLISASTYQEMVAPLDDELLAVYPQGGMIHLCGTHEHLIPVFHDMPHLRAVQLNDRAAHDLQKYFDGLREDQIIYLIPCDGMTVPMAQEITKGKRLVVVQAVDAPLQCCSCKH